MKIERLEKLKIPYLITGSIAAMAYGEPRLTNDIDIVADIDLNQAQIIKEWTDKLGLSDLWISVLAKLSE